MDTAYRGPMYAPIKANITFDGAKLLCAFIETRKIRDEGQRFAALLYVLETRKHDHMEKFFDIVESQLEQWKKKRKQRGAKETIATLATILNSFADYRASASITMEVR